MGKAEFSHSPTHSSWSQSISCYALAAKFWANSVPLCSSIIRGLALRTERMKWELKYYMPLVSAHCRCLQGEQSGSNPRVLGPFQSVLPPAKSAWG